VARDARGRLLAPGPGARAPVEELRRRIAPHVQHTAKVIAFGSVARGDSDAWSDLDLPIVTETTRPFFERYKDVDGLFAVWPRLDLLIYTPAEFEALVAEERPIVMQALREGIVPHPPA
jgi:predicted nucleotidyltransferase